MREPHYKKSHKAWYIHHGGKYVRLGKTKKEAWEEWHKLIAKGEQVIAPSAPVVILLDQFLSWTKKRRSQRTYDWYLMHLQSFSKHIGKKLQVSHLKPHHVTKWIDKAYQVASPSTVHGAIRAVQRAFTWACKEGYLTSSPVASIEKPTPTPREVVITPEEFDVILAKATDERERDFLTVQWETGMRTQEMREAEARHLEEDNQRLVFPASDAKGKRFPRVIYLNDKAMEIVTRLSKEFPEGPIFRNRKGLPWTRNAIRCRFLKHKRKGLCSTAIRHSWATHALARGVDPLTVSILLGHTDMTTLSRTYAHLSKNPDYMRDAVRRATTEGSQEQQVDPSPHGSAQDND